MGQEARQAVRQIYGLGPFGASNVMQLLGHYEDIPADSETARHLEQVRGLRATSAVAAQRVYAEFAPYQFLRYWGDARWVEGPFAACEGLWRSEELWRSYEERLGCPMWQASPESYRLLTGPGMTAWRMKRAAGGGGRQACG